MEANEADEFRAQVAGLRELGVGDDRIAYLYELTTDELAKIEAGYDPLWMGKLTRAFRERLVARFRTAWMAGEHSMNEHTIARAPFGHHPAGRDPMADPPTPAELTWAADVISRTADLAGANARQVVLIKRACDEQLAALLTTGHFTARGAVVLWVDPGDGGREVEINDVTSLTDDSLMTISRIANWWYLELPSLAVRMLDELAASGSAHGGSR